MIPWNGECEGHSFHLDVQLLECILVKDVYAATSVHQDLRHFYAFYDYTDH